MLGSWRSIYSTGQRCSIPAQQVGQRRIASVDVDLSELINIPHQFVGASRRRPVAPTVRFCQIPRVKPVIGIAVLKPELQITIGHVAGDA